MALNPYFLQGSRQEQRLVQNLVNEHLKILSNSGVDLIILEAMSSQSEIVEALKILTSL